MKIIYSIFERITWLVFFAYIRLLGKFIVEGRENLKDVPRPLLIISNHGSFLDPMAIATLFPVFSSYIPIGFIVADGYYRNPLLKIFFILNRTFPAHKGEGMEVSLKSPRKVLKEGGVFLIFPAGHRHPHEEQPKPRRGASFLALDDPERITILPMYINVSIRLTPKNLFLRRNFTKITVGQPFKLREKTNTSDPDEISLVLGEEIFKLNDKMTC